MKISPNAVYKTCTFEIDPIHDFEIRVKLDHNLVAFEEARLPVDILVAWYLSEV